MMHAEMESPFTAVGQEMIFSLVWPSRQRAVRYHALLVILPFLGLNGQCRAAVQGHGRTDLSPILWPVLRWFSWAGGMVHQQGSVANSLPPTTEPLPTAANRVVAANDFPLPAKAPGGQAPLLARLSPALLMTRLPKESAQRLQNSRSLPPGHAIPTTALGSTQNEATVSMPMPNPFQTAVSTPQPATAVNLPEPFAWSPLAGQAEFAPSTTSRTGAESVVPGRPIKTDDTVADALPDRKILPAMAGQRSEPPEPPALPGLNPSLMGIWAVAASVPAARHQGGQRKRPFAPSFAPATLTFNRAVMPSPAAYPADNTESSTLFTAVPAWRPTIAGEEQNGRELTRYAPSPAQGLTIVASVIERLVKQAVTTEIKRQKEGESQLNNRQHEVPLPTTSQWFHDDMVRQLMLRMHDLAQEDRFRMGRIR